VRGTEVAEALGLLRITRIDESATSVCLKVEGRLAGDWVALLESELEQAAQGQVALSLDLAGVDFASSQATEMLRAAAARGVRLSACSPFLSNLLAVDRR
jgi:anti-anti-sigma regulatory factor